VLRLAEALAGYAAGQVADGLSPEQARAAVIEAAGELADAAASLRKLALSPAERRQMAALLAGHGLSRPQIARRLGVSDKSVRSYLPRTGPQPPNLAR
jgi:ParB-like chromosome segregation protein Spo0J